MGTLLQQNWPDNAFKLADERIAAKPDDCVPLESKCISAQRD